MTIDKRIKRYVRLAAFAAVLASTGLAFGQKAPCDEGRLERAIDNCGTDMCCPAVRSNFYFQADALMLHRNVQGRTDIASLGEGGPIVLNTNSLDVPFQAGPRFLIGHSFADIPYQIEFSYFFLTSWNATAAVRDETNNTEGDQGNLFSMFTNFGKPQPIKGFDYNKFVTIRETSYFDNGELNIRRTLSVLTPGCATASVLLGVRHMGVKEGFIYHSESDIPIATGSKLDTTTHCQNDLWGPQIGGMLEIYCQDRWWVNCDLKGAICNNKIIRETTYQSAPVQPHEDYPSMVTTNSTAFVGDLDVTVICRLTEHFTTRIGYQAMWVTGLALAGRNSNINYATLLNGPLPIDSNGTTVYHGPHVGLELNW